jgi:hypothetical protein
MKRIIVIIAGFAMIAVSSCSKKPDVGGTAAEKLANEWYVDVYEGASLALSHAHIYTYNTSANTNEIFVDDDGHIWDFKVKATADLAALTFKADNVKSSVPGYDIKVNITDGKVIPNAGHSKTGNVTDSIFMKISFEDDPVPGTVYEIRGHARTRFAEDDY